jgi:hypothetical protein
MHTYTVKIPSKKAFLSLKSYLEFLGGTIVEENKTINHASPKTNLQQALEDVENENFAFSGSFEEFQHYLDEISTEECTQ